MLSVAARWSGASSGRRRSGVDEEAVAPLSRRGLILPRLESVMSGLQEFAFKHALTRDVAYGSLPHAERRDLHRRVAEWIQRVAPDRDVETAELAAYHYREAISYGEDDPEVVAPRVRPPARDRAVGAASRRVHRRTNPVRARRCLVRR